MELLESLRYKIGCFYISDLRTNPFFNKEARYNLWHINLFEYSIDEIVDAIDYLYFFKEF
jgi:hypothetical protein